MQEKIKLRMPVVVEGKYDRLRLQELIDGTILETGGFGIFRDKERLSMLRALAEKTGIVILTDSDRAGFMIRNYIRSAIPDAKKVINLYIPDVFGKERRKDAPSREGKLGVEGFSAEALYAIFQRAGLLEAGPPAVSDPVTKADLFSLGLSGGERAGYKRAALLRKLGLPERLTAKALLPVLNTLLTRAELEALVREIEEGDAG